MEVFLDRNSDFSLYIFVLFTKIHYTDIIQLVETKRYRLWNGRIHSIQDEKKKETSLRYKASSSLTFMVSGRDVAIVVVVVVVAVVFVCVVVAINIL